MLKFENVSFKRDDGPVLSGINLKIAKGNCLCAVGKNGAGKSTLCRLAGGLLLPTEGRVLMNGTATSEKKQNKVRESISYVFQEPDRQLCRETPLEEIICSLKAKKICNAEETAAIQCARMGLPADGSLFTMSRGARQMTAIASAVASSPSLLILDEPTSALDTAMRKSLAQIIKEEKARGAAILLITHDPEFAALCSDDILVLCDGRAAVSAPAEEVLKDRKTAHMASFRLPVLCELALCLGIEPDINKSAEELAFAFCDSKERVTSRDKKSNS